MVSREIVEWPDQERSLFLEVPSVNLRGVGHWGL